MEQILEDDDGTLEVRFDSIQYPEIRKHFLFLEIIKYLLQNIKKLSNECSCVMQ